jgi:hypothetical protein
MTQAGNGQATFEYGISEAHIIWRRIGILKNP